jgi:Cys-tRNA(Pro)/Cys-tRNA(Cys) deacylase
MRRESCSTGSPGSRNFAAADLWSAAERDPGSRSAYNGGHNGIVAATPAVEVLVQTNTAFTLHEYRHDATAASIGRAAAAALGIDPERVFKTLVFEGDGELGVAVLPVSRDLDLKALAVVIGVKRTAMADRATAERATGYVVGGISPLGQRHRLATALEASATSWPTIFVSGGRRGLEIELAPTDLIALSGALLAPFARTPFGAGGDAGMQGAGERCPRR